MNGFTRTPRRIGAGSLLWLGPVVLGLSLADPESANASAIHHAHHATADDAGLNRSWSTYLMSGPSVWSAVAHPGLTPGIEAEMWKAISSDPPPNIDAVVQFFLYKQSLDPARFDHYHPHVAKALAKIKAEEATTTATPTASTTSTGTPSEGAQTLGPPASTPDENTVPEPGTFLLTIGMAGYAIWWRRRRV